MYIRIIYISIVVLLGGFYLSSSHVEATTGCFSGTLNCNITTLMSVSIVSGDLCIGSNGFFDFGQYNVSSSSQTVNGGFSSPFWVDDLNGSDNGYYTTIQMSGHLQGPGNSSIAGENVSMKSTEVGHAAIITMDGSVNTNVVVDSAMSTYQTLDIPRKLIKRVTGTNYGLIGRYGVVPSMQLIIPPYQAVGSYTGTLVYTLYEDVATPIASYPSSSQWLDSSNFIFNSRNGSITNYIGASGIDIIIPATITGKVVTSIGSNVFANKQLISVLIPDSVTSIGVNAFYSNQLTSIFIPSSVTSIGLGAFSNNQLTSITIPASVTSIGSNAFYNNNLTSVVIPNSVTSIGNNVFQNNQLTSVSIPNSIISIGNHTFNNNKLISVSIPNSVISIGSYTFNNNQLTSVSIPNSVISIGNNAFSNNKLTSVTISNTISTLGNNIFQNNQLTSVTIPDSVTSIGNYTFQGNQITSVIIPNTVTSIGNYAFYVTKGSMDGNP